MGGEFQGYLTDDETEVVEIINGLENQAVVEQSKAKQVMHEELYCGIGAASALTLFFLEHSPDPFNYEKVTYMSLAAAFTLGGIAKFVKEQRILGDAARKNKTANQLRQELDPADVGLFDDHFNYSKD